MAELAEQDAERAHFLALIRSFDTAMLVTHPTVGPPRARPMAVAKIEDDGTTWFVTSSGTAKVDELEQRSDVNVTMQSASTFASLSGAAELVQDRARVRELWREPWRVWFPDGPDTADLLVLRVEPRLGEYWDQRGPRGLRYLWEAAKAYAGGTRIDENDTAGDPKQHGKVDL